MKVANERQDLMHNFCVQMVLFPWTSFEWTKQKTFIELKLALIFV